MRRRFVAGIIVVSALVASLSIWYPGQPEPEPPPPNKKDPPTPHANASHVDYNRDVLPILSNKCYACHGPDTAARKGKLRLDLAESATKAGRTGAIPIVPGKSAQSEVIRRIHSNDDEERMPPRKGGKPLTDAEKSILKRWIDQGAAYKLHWAFARVERPATPAVEDKSWGKNEVDAFVLDRLEEAGLKPSPRADRVTLIRRLSFDLRGLPPSLAEVDEFLADKAADAYEKLVERMLASPHFGEKMAVIWLDLARFGDTSGYHMDSTRQMHLWRDWVINAYNSNMRFDQFTIEQLAGDLLPGATIQQKIASGFNRNSRYNEEDGVDPEEYLIRYTIDRTNTMGQTWLGLTLTCAECHSHKYDPISHKEYYQLFAYFGGIKEPTATGHAAHGKPLPPLVRLATAEQAKELSDYRKGIARAEKAIAKYIGGYKDYLEGKEVPAEPSPELVDKSQRAWEVIAKKDDKLPEVVRRALKVDADKRDEASKKTLREYYLRNIRELSRDIIGIQEQDIADFTKSIKEIEDDLPYSLVSEEMGSSRPAYVLIRGDFQQRGEKVERGVPAAFGPLPANAPANRLGLARWLVRPENPLTARVAVNRLWAQMFGHGIVRSIGDFGTQGDFPTHPDLLDWLASEFVRNGWDVKAMLRLMANSAAYQQSSAITASIKSDPENHLLSRAVRHRLGAEELRDSALAIAGLVNPKIGGPSFMPYQPPDFYKNKNEQWPWKASQGEEQYRRGLYAFWRRTALHPMFAVLDAPNREECTSMRPRTNTPLQALVTLNDPSFVEAARVFAQKILTTGPKDLDARLAFAFRSATCRQPSNVELKRLRNDFRYLHTRYQADRDLASKLVNVGQYPRDAALDVADHAAWTAFANMLLNLDEVLTRE
jgi:hypothetical protein